MNSVPDCWKFRTLVSTTMGSFSNRPEPQWRASLCQEISNQLSHTFSFWFKVWLTRNNHTSFGSDGFDQTSQRNWSCVSSPTTMTDAFSKLARAACLWINFLFHAHSPSSKSSGLRFFKLHDKKSWGCSSNLCALLFFLAHSPVQTSEFCDGMWQILPLALGFEHSLVHHSCHLENFCRCLQDEVFLKKFQLVRLACHPLRWDTCQWWILVVSWSQDQWLGMTSLLAKSVFQLALKLHNNLSGNQCPCWNSNSAEVSLRVCVSTGADTTRNLHLNKCWNQMELRIQTGNQTVWKSLWEIWVQTGAQQITWKSTCVESCAIWVLFKMLILRRFVCAEFSAQF